MQVNWCGERMGPFHHGRVEMRVGNGDGIDAAETLDHRHSRVVERSNAIPQNIAVVRAHEQRPLADCECGRGTDADDAPLVFPERVGVGLSQSLKRGPGLAARGHVLALLLADDAMNGRLRALRVLRATCGADRERHRFNSLALRDAIYGVRSYQTGWAFKARRLLNSWLPWSVSRFASLIEPPLFRKRGGIRPGGVLIPQTPAQALTITRPHIVSRASDVRSTACGGSTSRSMSPISAKNTMPKPVNSTMPANSSAVSMLPLAISSR